jgi:hypothetical protein
MLVASFTQVLWPLALLFFDLGLLPRDQDANASIAGQRQHGDITPRPRC